MVKPSNPGRLARHAKVFLIAALFGGAAYAVIRGVIWVVEAVIGGS